MRAVLVAVAAFLAWWLVRALARHLGGHADPSVPKRAGALFTDALLVGMLAARLGYVLRWWPEYAVAPWSILAIGDGGFLWWIGLPAALAFAGHIQIIVRIAVENITALSGNTSDIIFTGDPAHAVTAADRIAGRSGNSSHIAASGTLYGCIRLTGNDCAIFCFTDHTADIVFFTGHVSKVAAVSDDCLDRLLHIETLRSG